MAWTLDEFAEKTGKIRQLMVEENINNLVITNHINFTWLTGGRAYINSAAERACCDLVITPDKVFLLANNIEADRLISEEAPGLPIEKLSYSWWEATGTGPLLKEIAGDGKIATDVELGGKFSRLRWELSPQDRIRFLDTGSSAAAALDEVAYTINPGQTEQEIAKLIRVEALALGVLANVALVAVDGRAFQYRHPLPTESKLDRYAMLVISGEKYGLYASATRLVHFGEPPAELKKRHKAVAQVDVAFISASRPGATIGEVFETGRQAYRSVGFADEWQFHHQGGMTGYLGREVRATDRNKEIIQVGQAFAWNPTIAGTKSEDTVVVEKGGNVVVTSSSRFPQMKVEFGGVEMKRPGILIR